MRERLMVSFFLALVVHLLAFLILQQLIRFERFRLPERIGPIVVELAEVPVPAEVREPPPEPRREPPPQASTRETAVAPASSTAAPRAAPAASATARPRVAPGVPTPKPQPEQQPTPRSSSRTEPRALPAEPSATEPALALRTAQPQPQQPAHNQPVAVPKEQEMRPEAGADQPPVLDLSGVDTALSGSAPASASGAAPAAGGTPSGSAAGGSTAAGSPAATPRDYSIVWDRPEQGRQAIDTPAPDIPASVSQRGTRLQVTVSFELTADGLLREVKVELSSGYSDVDKAVLEALRRWRFRAAPGGKDVSGRVRYSIVPR